MRAKIRNLSGSENRPLTHLVEDDVDGLFEFGEQFFQPGVVLAGEEGREVLYPVEFALCRADDVTVAMLVDIKPVDEQPVPQTFLLVARFAEVEHGFAAVCREELLDDGEDGLSEFLVAGRSAITFGIDAELVGSALYEGVFEHETDSVSQPEICVEIKRILVALCLTHHIR